MNIIRFTCHRRINLNVCFYCLFSILTTTSSAESSSSSSKPALSDLSQTKPISSSTGDRHTDLEHIEIKLAKTNDEHLSNQKHSTNNSNNSTTSGGFSLKNSVSSFRSWVSNRKSPKEDSTITSMNHSVTTYGKIDTSPTPRKSSLGSGITKRNRTNSASATTTTSVINNNHHQQPIQQSQTNSSSATSSTRVKKKSSFTLRNTNPIALLKRTSEANHNQTDISLTEQTGTGGGGGGGPFGYFKNLVRGDTSSSEKKQ